MLGELEDAAEKLPSLDDCLMRMLDALLARHGITRKMIEAKFERYTTEA